MAGSTTSFTFTITTIAFSKRYLGSNMDMVLKFKSAVVPTYTASFKMQKSVVAAQYLYVSREETHNIRPLLYCGAFF